MAAELKEKLLEETARRLTLSEATESVAWLNRTLDSMWPHLDRWLSATLRSLLIRSFVAFNQPAENGKPKSLQLDVNYVSFGSQPIKIEGVTAKPASGAPYTSRIDLDFVYRGDLVIELQASLPFGMKVPVSLKDLEMIGKMKIELAFKDKGAIKHCSICFLTPPTLNFSIRTLAKLDIMDLPTLKETINTVLVLQMRQLMTYPNALTFDWSGAQQASEELLTAEERAMQQQKFVYQTVSLDDASSTPTAAPQILTQPSASISSTAASSSDTASTTFKDPLTSDSVPTASSRSSLTPEKKVDTLKQTSSSITPRSASSPSSSVPASTRAKPMQSFAKQKEDLNEFLLMSPEEFRGTLSVRIVECVNLPTSDIFSVSPYVSLEMNGVMFKTAVVKRTSSPAWNNAVFEFPVPRYLPAKGLHLRLQVLDKSKIGSDESLGYTSINIERFLKTPDELQFLNEPLVSASSGRIHLQIKYVVES